MGQKTKKAQVEFKQAVQLPLTPELAESVTTLIMDKSLCFENLLQLVDEGYAVTLKPSPNGEGRTCSIMPVLAELPNAGTMAFANGPDALGALGSMLVKLNFYRLDSSWSEHHEKNQATRYW